MNEWNSEDREKFKKWLRRFAKIFAIIFVLISTIIAMITLLTLLFDITSISELKLFLFDIQLPKGETATGFIFFFTMFLGLLFVAIPYAFDRKITMLDILKDIGIELIGSLIVYYLFTMTLQSLIDLN